jgi:hypothetical protein
MPGQISNFLRSFEKIKGFLGNVFHNDYVQGLLPLAGAGMTALSLIDRGNRLDNETNVKDKVVDGLHMAADIASLPVPFPASIPVSLATTGVIDGASYITDVLAGKKDPPPMAADVNGRNGVGNIPNKVVTSQPFQQYFSNFGSNTGLGGGLF